VAWRCASSRCVVCTTTGRLRLMELMEQLLPGLVRINQPKRQPTFLEIAANGHFHGLETFRGEGISLANDGQKVDAFGEIANHAKFTLRKRSACPARFGIVIVVCQLYRRGTGRARIGPSAGSCGHWARMCAHGGSRGDGGDSGWRMVVASSLRDDYIGI